MRTVMVWKDGATTNIPRVLEDVCAIANRDGWPASMTYPLLMHDARELVTFLGDVLAREPLERQEIAEILGEPETFAAFVTRRVRELADTAGDATEYDLQMELRGMASALEQLVMNRQDVKQERERAAVRRENHEMADFLAFAAHTVQQLLREHDGAVVAMGPAMRHNIERLEAGARSAYDVLAARIGIPSTAANNGAAAAIALSDGVTPA